MTEWKDIKTAPAKPERCGSYPFMNIAEDFGLPYGMVLNYVEWRKGKRNYFVLEAYKEIFKMEITQRLDFQIAIDEAMQNATRN